MPSIQAGTDPNIPYPKHTFWFWELVNVLVPLIGIIFLDWHIFTLVILFWWEIFCWGAVGILKIISAFGVRGLLPKIASTIGNLIFFGILYFALILILVSFSLVEFDSDNLISGDKGLMPGIIVIGINFLIEYFRSEIATGRWQTRTPMEVIFERFIYALPLAALILFAVLPLSQRFEGASAEKIIGIGIILSKFLMDVAMHYLPGIVIQYNDVEYDEEGNKISGN